jgi:hypothetical protein
MIAVLLLAALLDFGPERELAGNPTVGLAPRGRERARVAASDQGALVVWSDGRTGERNVYATRLDGAGKVLDRQGIVIATGIAGDVVWTGRAYLVAYAVHPIVYVRTVTPEGVLGDPIPIVDTDWVAAHTVRLVTDGSTVLLMTNSGRGAVLTLDGEKRRALDFGIVPSPEWGLDLAVSHDGYGMASVVAEGAAFRRIRAENEEPAQLLPGSKGAATVALGSDGTSFLAAYDSKTGTVPHLRAHRIGDAAVHTLGSAETGFPKIVWRGSDYLITFTRRTNVDALAVRVSAAGEPLGEPLMFATATPPSQPDADRRPDGTGVAAWVSGHSRVEVGFFDTADAAPADVAPVSFSAPEQRLVRVDTRGGDVFTMWLEAEHGSRSVRLGRGIGGPGLTLAAGEVLPVDVVVDGNVIWAIWWEWPSGAFVRRYTPALAPIDAAPVRIPSFFVVDEYGTRPRVAAGGGSLVLVAANGEREPGIDATVAREVDGALAFEFHILRTEYLSRHPAVAWNGSEFVIAWANAQNLSEYWTPPVDEHLVMQRLGADGVPLDAVPVTLSSDPGRSIHAVEAVRSDDDVALFWQTSPLGDSVTRDTLAVHVRSGEHHAVANPLRRSLRAVATVGERFLMLWNKDDVEYVLLSEGFAEIERGAAPVPQTDFDLAAAGSRPVVGYSRVADEYGRVFRAYVRTTLSPRNRAVRK